MPCQRLSIPRHSLQPSPGIVDLLNRNTPGFAAVVLLASPDTKAAAVLISRARHSAAIVSILPVDRAARPLDQMSADRSPRRVANLSRECQHRPATLRVPGRCARHRDPRQGQRSGFYESELCLDRLRLRGPQTRSRHLLSADACDFAYFGGNRHFGGLPLCKSLGIA